jgi:molecular chaperone DnaK
VFQGEREMAADNKSLGQFDLVGIPPSPRGTPQIEVSFDIDANGIVNVSAKDKASGKEQSIRIEASGGLSDADVQRMVKEAETNADADKQRKALVEARNHADVAIYAAERSLRDDVGKAPAEVRAALEAAVAAAKSAVEGEELTLINQTGDALAQAAARFAETLQAPEAAEGAPDQGGAKAADVVDAEFEEVAPPHRKAS